VLFVWQVSRAATLLSEESKEHGLIVERQGKYVPVVDEPRKSSKSRLPSDGESWTVTVRLLLVYRSTWIFAILCFFVCVLTTAFSHYCN